MVTGEVIPARFGYCKATVFPSVIKKYHVGRGTWLAHSEDHETLDLGVGSSSPMLGAEPIKKKKEEEDYSNNHPRQDPLMDAKIRGRNFGERQDMCTASKYLPIFISYSGGFRI